MNIQKILTLGFLCVFISCTKSPDELLELSEENVKNNQIDLAIDQLKTLLKNHPNDSLASKAQYKLASIYLSWKNDPAQGYVELQNTVDKYEKSVQGQKAQNQITAFPEYIINKAESLQKQKMLKEAVNHLMFMMNKYNEHQLAPKAQYMLGDLYMNNFRDFTTAIQEYRKVLDNYGGSNQEPHALFMIGYIYANIINDEKSAKIEYNAFLNRFPKHELAPSVKFELEYLGKSIEEIPALKHITS
ncbi:MAG: tetratricopeptide repeat protein [Candidatus Neomarinimicrobiota bacterium]